MTTRASPADRTELLRGRVSAHAAAMTLLELLAVMTIIAVLTVAVIGMAGYAQRRSGVGRAQAEIRALESAIEDYKTDTGSYPTSAYLRYSAAFEAERTNSALLYQQLVAGPKKYFRPTGGQVSKTGNLTFFTDPYGIPYDYYYYPLSNTAAWVGVPASNWVAGGLHNVNSFDLSSHGSDHRPYVDGFPSSCNPNAGWTLSFCPAAGLDDITNWSP